MNVNTRRDAVELGQRFYDTGNPCRHGHFAKRSVDNYQCVKCQAFFRDRYRKTVAYQKTCRARYQKLYLRDPCRFIYDRARGRARRGKQPFNLTVEYLRSIWPVKSKCPALGIKLKPSIGNGRWTPNSPSLDKINPKLGYVRGNVAIISMMANQMKSYTNDPKLIRKLATWLEKVHRQRGPSEGS